MPVLLKLIIGFYNSREVGNTLNICFIKAFLKLVKEVSFRPVCLRGLGFKFSYEISKCLLLLAKGNNLILYVVRGINQFKLHSKLVYKFSLEAIKDNSFFSSSFNI